MTICVDIDQAGYITATGDEVADCTALVLISAPEYSYISSFAMPTAAELLWLYTWGMGAILLPWSIGYAIGVAKKTVNKV